MKSEDYSRREELEEKQRKSEEQIEIGIKKLKGASKKQLDYKATATLVLSMIAYYGLFAATFLSAQLIDISVLTNGISPYSIPLIYVGASLGIGTIGRKIIENKKSKENSSTELQNQTQVEKEVEEISHEIELEKAIQRNKVVNEMIESSDSKESPSQEISEADVNTVPDYSKEEGNEVEKLSTKLEQNYEELDILSTRKALNDLLQSQRNERGNLPLVAICGGLATMLFSTMPCEILDCSIATKQLIPIVSIIAGSLGSSIYWHIRNNIREKAINSVNDRFDEIIISENGEIEKLSKQNEKINNILEAKIKDIAKLENKLTETKQIFETIKADNSKLSKVEDNSKILEQPIAHSYEEKKLSSPVLPYNPNKYLNEPKLEEDSTRISAETTSNNKHIRKRSINP